VPVAVADTLRAPRLKTDLLHAISDTVGDPWPNRSDLQIAGS
jgi:hypothetical protein